MAAITASSTGAGMVPDFQYKGLPDPEAHIRLLEIKPSKTKRGRQKYRCHYGSVADYEDDTVECLMTIWPTNDTPDYVAISYTWGQDNSNTDSSVLINGRRFRVGKNCDEALRQARRHDGAKYCWIDAICINQTTDHGNYEKNHQVRIMGDIYRNASHILACVGPCDETSHRLIRMVEWPRWPRGFITHAHEWFREWLWVVIVLGPADLTFLLLYRQFIKRTFFKRVWILQELFLAQHVVISCGSHFVTVRNLDRRLRPAQQRLDIEVVHREKSHSYDWILRLAGQKRLIPSSEGNKRFISWTRPTFLHAMSDMSVDHLSLATSSSKEQLTLEKAFSQAAALKCSEPRDRIYGILSMVRWSGPDYITPDYNKPKLELAAEILWALRIEEANRLRYFVNQIISALSMRLEDADVAGAIFVRHSGITTPVPAPSTKRQLTDNTRRLSSVFKFHGRRICEEDEWILAPGLHNLEGDAQQDGEPNGLRYQTIRSNTTGKIIGFVPEATRPDDWIITDPSLYSTCVTLGRVIFDMVLIARQRPPRQQWQLESPAFISSKAIKKHPLTKFDVYFNPQDLLLLFMQTNNQFTRFTTTAHRIKRVTAMLQVRFCQVEGSSYALQDGYDSDRRTNENSDTHEDSHISEGLDPSDNLDNDEDRDTDEDWNSDLSNSGGVWRVIKRVS
ncbi:Fc.00g057850.m01.CDS01 [Cosmosporella sp. VM-42]